MGIHVDRRNPATVIQRPDHSATYRWAGDVVDNLEVHAVFGTDDPGPTNLT